MLISFDTRSHIIHKMLNIANMFNILLRSRKTTPDMTDIGKHTGVQTKCQNR